MRDVLGWFTALLPVLVTCALLGTVMVVGRSGKKPSGGSLGMIDEVWAPSAAEARALWEAEQRLPVEAPSPDPRPRDDLWGDGTVVIRLR